MVEAASHERLVGVPVQELHQHQITNPRWRGDPDMADRNGHAAELQVLVLDPHVGLVVVLVVLGLVGVHRGNHAEQGAAVAGKLLLHHAAYDLDETAHGSMDIRMSVTNPSLSSKRWRIARTYPVPLTSSSGTSPVVIGSPRSTCGRPRTMIETSRAVRVATASRPAAKRSARSLVRATGSRTSKVGSPSPAVPWESSSFVVSQCSVVSPRRDIGLSPPTSTLPHAAPRRPAAARRSCRPKA